MPRAGWLAAGAVAGALAGAVVPDALVAGLATAVTALAAWLASKRDVRAALVLVGATLVLGRATIGFALTPPAVADPIEPTGQLHLAHVLSVSTPQGGQQRVVLELEPPEPADRVYAWLPRYPQVAMYDRVEFKAPLEAVAGDDDFADYLARSGIGYTARVSKFEVAGAQDTPLADLEHVRRTAADLLARAVPAPQAGLAASLLVGVRDTVAPDISADFRASGLSHIVAISGSHLALLAGLCGSLLGRLSRRRRSIVLIAIIWAYSLLAGAGPSVVRAALMTTVVVAARESGRQGQARGALALTALLMLVVDPTVVGDVGFQLSLAATAGLLVWSAAFGERLRRRLPAGIPRVLIEGLGISLAAQLATQPLILAHFGQLSVVSPLANLLAAPLVAPAMLSSAAALAASAATSVGAPDIIATPFAMLAALCVGALIAVAHICASLPLASLRLTPPFDLIAAALAAALIAPFLRRARPSAPDTAQAAIEARRDRTAAATPSRRRLVIATAAAVGALLLSTMVASAQPDGRLHMTVLDVGQGDSILLQGPRGGRILIDTGPDPDRLLSLLDSRLPAWDRRLDVVIVTHPHEDHVAGLALLLDRYRIGEIAEPGMIGLGPGDSAFRRRLADLGRQTTLLAAGDRLSLDGIELDVLWPIPGKVPLHPADGGTAVNNVSIVLEMQYGRRRFLLGGDIEQQIDPQLLAGALGPGTPPFDVLKVAHHGSGTATTEAFLDRIHPQVAIISAGWGNPYGHPSPNTVQRLKDSGAHVFRTDLDGSVAVTTDGLDLTATATGGRPIPEQSAAAAALPIGGVGWCPIPLTAAVADKDRIQYGP